MPENKENILRILFEFLFFYRAFGFCLLMLLFQVSFLRCFLQCFFLRFFAFLSCIRRNLLPFVRGERTPFYLVYFGNRKGICSFLLRPRNILIFIAPAFSKVRYRGSTFRPFVRSFVRSSVRLSVRPQFASSLMSSLGINFISLQQW